MCPLFTPGWNSHQETHWCLKFASTLAFQVKEIQFKIRHLEDGFSHVRESERTRTELVGADFEYLRKSTLLQRELRLIRDIHGL